MIAVTPQRGRRIILRPTAIYTTSLTAPPVPVNGARAALLWVLATVRPGVETLNLTLLNDFGPAPAPSLQIAQSGAVGTAPPMVVILRAGTPVGASGWVAGTNVIRDTTLPADFLIPQITHSGAGAWTYIWGMDLVVA